MQPVLEALEQRPLLTDGGMGTALLSSGAGQDQCLEELNLSRPDWIRTIQLDYAKAGADIILSHTFGANEIRLQTHGLGDKVEEINRAAVRIARDVRETFGKALFIGGDIGPLGLYLAPQGPLRPEVARAAFLRQAAALLEGGIDFYCIETFSDLRELEQAVSAIRELTDLPILTSLTFGRDAQTTFGADARTVMRFVQDLEIEIVGANCSVGPSGLEEIIAIFHAEDPTAALAVMPNAGFPSRVEEKLEYPAGPAYFAAVVPAFLNLGASIIGGCCGTTKAHIQAMRKAIDHWQRSTPNTQFRLLDRDLGEEEIPASYLPWIVSVPELEQQDSQILQKLEAGHFVVSVEVDPPRGLNPEKQIEGARLARKYGADAVNVADSPMARVRMSALAMAAQIQQQAGIETILHFTTRDRSLMGLQADLLGAHALGLRNILALTGDPPSLGGNQNSSAVYDVDSVGLVHILNQFNQGQDLEGKVMGQRSRFSVSVACDPTREDLDKEAGRLRAKLSHGAHFIMTQPIYDSNVWNRFTKTYERLYGPLPVPVLIGILPLQSFKHASFLHNEVPGITLGGEALARMKEAGKRGRQAGIEMGQELLRELQDAPYVQGVYLMPSFGRYETACQVLNVLNLEPSHS